MTDLIARQSPEIVGDSEKKLVKIKGVTFEEDFVAELISQHFNEQALKVSPTITTAFEIYMREHPHSHRKKFFDNSTRYFKYFLELFGDLRLDELRHTHITKYRDHQLQRGLKPSSVRKHNNTLNAIINMAFKHLDIDKLSPFRALRIRGESDLTSRIPQITEELIQAVNRTECAAPFLRAF